MNRRKELTTVTTALSHCARTELKFILDRARVRGEYKLHTEIVTIPDFNFPFNINHPLILFIFSSIYIHSYIIYF